MCIRDRACGYRPITKKIMDLTRKKQVVKWQTSPYVGVLNCDIAVSRRFFGTSRSHLSLEGWTSRLVAVLTVWQNGTSRSRLGLEGWPSRSCNLTSCGHPWFQLLTGTSSLRTDRANDYNTQVLHIHTTNGVIQSNKHIQKNMFGNLLFDETVAWVLDKSLRLRRVTWWLQTWHRQHGHMSHGRQMHTCHCCIQPAALVGDSRHTNKHSTDKRPYDNSDNNETFARHMMSAIRRHRKRQEWTGRERTIL